MDTLPLEVLVKIVEYGPEVFYKMSLLFKDVWLYYRDARLQRIKCVFAKKKSLVKCRKIKERVYTFKDGRSVYRSDEIRVYEEIFERLPSGLLHGRLTIRDIKSGELVHWGIFVDGKIYEGWFNI